jgi:carbonic anhydrase
MRAPRLTVAILLVFGTGISLGCGQQTSAPTSLSDNGPRLSAHGVPFTHASAGTFAYFGDNGPAFWGSLDPAWGACANGRIQSPVDLSRDLIESRSQEKLNIEYGPTTGEIFNNGHTIEVETEGDNVLTFGGTAYALSQFHFHGPSEHTIEGRGRDMELHLVHTSAAGTNAVVAVLLNRGEESGALSQIFEQLPDDLNVPHVVEGSFNPAHFLPRNRTHVRFRGSLTTPPCSEGVHWFVLTRSMTLSSEDMAQFHERIHFNARPVQRSLD